MRFACFHSTASSKCARRAHLELVSLACVHPTASSKWARRAHLELVSLACVHHCHNFTTHKCVRYQDLFLTEAKFAANKYPLCQKKCFKHWFSPEANTRTLPNYEQQQEKKKLPLALIALIALNLKTLLALNMSAEKLSSPRGDPDLLLCGPWGRPKKKKVRYLLRPYGLHCFYADNPDYPPIGGNKTGAKRA